MQNVKRSRASVGEEYDRVVEARRVTDATSDELVQGFSPMLTEDPHVRLVRDLSGAISGVSEGNSLGGLDGSMVFSNLHSWLQSLMMRCGNCQ